MSFGYFFSKFTVNPSLVMCPLIVSYRCFLLSKNVFVWLYTSPIIKSFSGMLDSSKLTLLG